MFVCKGYSSKFMASERVKFVTAFVLFVAFVNLHRSKQNLMQKYTQLEICASHAWCLRQSR